MMQSHLHERLGKVVARRQRYLAAWYLTITWVMLALLGLLFYLVGRQTGWLSPWVLPILVVLGVGVSGWIFLRTVGSDPDYRAIAREIERHHPELKGLLLTAVQQKIDEGKAPSYLQYRVLQQALERSGEADWRDIIPPGRMVLGYAAQGLTLAAAAFMLSQIWVNPLAQRGMGGAAPLWGISVTPGDTTIERGESLVVLARFGGTLPAGVQMVVRTSGQVPRTIPLVKNLADPVFGGTIAEVDANLTYQLEYAGRSTPEYTVGVFEFPRMERADATLTFPEYTQLDSRRIDNTTRISAVEGTQIELALQLNKPVVTAELVTRDANRTVVPLEVSPDRAVATLPAFALVASHTYDLRLVDADGRANKVATPFVFDALPNRTPELRLASPAGDQQPSAIEEITFQGTVLDDFGSPAYGIGYSVGGAEPAFIELGSDVAARERREFNYELHLEDLGLQPEQLISWYVWADDIGPDGQLRRTTSDLFFGEIRRFDQVFRENQQPQQQQQQQQQQAGQNQQQRQRLIELQKQIITATWNLQRDSSSATYEDDTGVVQDSQNDAIEQAQSAQDEANGAQAQALWASTLENMDLAASALGDAADDPSRLSAALSAEQAAYQNLLQLQSEETQVAQGQPGGGGGGGGGQTNQNQLNQLELSQSDNRYETQRQAAQAQQERSEQLQVANRLEELARRQQDMNERMRELQTAMQEARTEEEREQIRRELQRLQEDQQQLVSDVDELNQRMDQMQNQTNITEQRQQLDDVRDEAQRAADAAQEGEVSQALAAGTRAQRQMEEAREELRRQTSSAFEEELRQLRTDARDLANRQREIGNRLSTANDPNARRSLSDPDPTQQVLQDLQLQRQDLENVVNQAKSIANEAIFTEPLLTQQLEDTLRELVQNDEAAADQFRRELAQQGLLTSDLNQTLQDDLRQDGGKALEVTSEMMEFGERTRAIQANDVAQQNLDTLRDGLEAAAESVIGDDAQALRLAQQEIDQAVQDLRREASNQAGPQSQQGQQGQAGQQGQQGQPGEQGQQGQGQQQTAQYDQQGQQPGQQGQQGQQGQGGQQGQQGQQGQGGQQTANNENQQGQQGQQGGQGGGQGGQQGQQGQGDGAGDPQQQLAQDGQQGGAGQQPGQQAGRGANPRGGANFTGGAQAPQLLTGTTGTRQANDPLDLNNLLGADAPLGPAAQPGPITGDDFVDWSDGLRNVEEIVDSPEWRNAVATARERARLARQAFTRDGTMPDWAAVELDIVSPLVEVRTQIAEDLARRDSDNPLVAIDRDPVPARHATAVQRYYEELGRDQQQ